MGTFSPNELLMFWKQKTITPAMAISHLIQQQATIETLQQRVTTLQTTVEQLAGQQSPPADAGKRRRKR